MTLHAEGLGPFPDGQHQSHTSRGDSPRLGGTQLLGWWSGKGLSLPMGVLVGSLCTLTLLSLPRSNAGIPWRGERAVGQWVQGCTLRPANCGGPATATVAASSYFFSLPPVAAQLPADCMSLFQAYTHPVAELALSETTHDQAHRAQGDMADCPPPPAHKACPAAKACPPLVSCPPEKECPDTRACAPCTTADTLSDADSKGGSVAAGTGSSAALVDWARRLAVPWGPLLTQREAQRALCYGSGKRLQEVAAKLMAGKPIKVRGGETEPCGLLAAPNAAPNAAAAAGVGWYLRLPRCGANASCSLLLPPHSICSPAQLSLMRCWVHRCPPLPSRHRSSHWGPV